MSKAGLRIGAALALQLAALTAIALSLLGFSWLDARSKPGVLVLVDRSESMPRAEANEAAAEVARAADAAGAAEPRRIEFAGRPASPDMPPGSSPAQLEPWATNIEAALQAALEVHARSPIASLVVVSDGLENRGDGAQALHSAREAGVALSWIAAGRPPPPTWIAEVLAPQRTLNGQRIRITVQLAGELGRPLRVKASARSVGGAIQSTSGAADNTGRATIEFDAERTGAVLVDVAAEDAASGRTFDAWPDAAVIDVMPRKAILYAQGSPGLLARSLQRGGWALNVVPSTQLDAQADALDGYRAVVLDDVAIADASPRFWNALVSAVKDRGVGLVVLGGERSFSRGGYRQSTLESVLPVISEPPALDQPAAIVFAVDKSGSMGQGSGGVDRFQLAQRAVLESARGLSDRDALGLVVFDVAARVLIPLGPAVAGASALERDWLASPNGGTKLAPALDAAIGELERSGSVRRLLVLVTDGFVDQTPLDGLRVRLDRARIETIALTVGPDSDVDALQRLVSADAGVVLRVDQAADLPLAMRTGLERRRGRVERGAIGVEQRQPLPFSPGEWRDWPDIAAYAVTRTNPDAWTAVQSHRGDPLIAFRRAGSGRVVAVTSGFGHWTPLWWRWREWPRLAGGLADWSAGAAEGGGAALTVSDVPGGLQIDAELPPAASHPDVQQLSVVVDTPTTQGQLLAMEQVAHGRLRAMLRDARPGLYTFVTTGSRGTQRHLHLRRHRGETEVWGINPALATWTASGLVSPWDPALLAQHRVDARGSQPIDRSLVGLGTMLFLLGILVDRSRPSKIGILDVLRRWREWVAAHRV